MKKVVSFIIIALIALFVYQLTIGFLKTSHEVEYKIISNDIEYLVKENYRKRNMSDYYLFEVSTENRKYIFEYPNKFNKQKKVVTNIKEYNYNNTYCLSLIYNDKESLPVCIKNNELISFNLLSSDEIKKFTELFGIEGYNVNNKEEISLGDDLSYYKDNLYEDENIILYLYKRIMKVNLEENKSFTFSTIDVYKNEFGRLVGKYYVVPTITSSPEISKYLYYNITSDVKKEIKLPVRLSKQSIINGIYDDKMYIFDKSAKKQFVLDPYKGTYEQSGNDESGFTLTNGSLEEISVKELSDNLFTENKGRYENIECDEIIIGKYYAIYSLNNKWYKVYEKYLDNPILILEGENIKEVKEKEGTLYFIDGEYLYRYDQNGRVPLIKREEFKYNFENVYDIYIGS